MEATHRKFNHLTSLTSLWRCALLTGWYWSSITQGFQWSTSGRSFVIPDIFCDHAVYVSIWVIDTEQVTVKFLSQEVFMEFTISGNSLRSVALPCEKKNWIENVTSAYSMTSSKDVAVYIEYSQDGSMVRPLITLGRHFFVLNLATASSANQRTQGNNFIAITSVSQNTLVELRFPAQTNQTRLGSFTKSDNGEFYILSLDKFRTALVSSAASLWGIRIKGSDGLLVLVGTIHQMGTGHDKVLLIDELPAVENYGKEYFVYAPDWIKDGTTVYVSGLGLPTNFSVETKGGKSELTLSEFGNTSFHLSNGDYALIRSIEATLIVISDRPSQVNPNVSHISTETPLTYYANLAKLSLPPKEPNDSYILVTTVQENCNQSNLISNLPSLIPQQIFTNISGRNFSVYRSLNDTLIKDFVNDTKKFGVLVQGFLLRQRGAIFRTYSFPLFTFPIVPCSSNQSLMTALTNSELGNHLRGNDVDDDCDGREDEELLNGQDDDGDGFVDEDIVFGCWNSAGSGPVDAKTPGEILDIADNLHFHPSHSYYHGSILALFISLAIAVWAAAMLLGGALLLEYHRRESAKRSTSISPIIED